MFRAWRRIKKLKVKKSARNDGRLNSPAPDSTARSETEEAIDLIFKNSVIPIKDSYITQLDRCSEDLAFANPDHGVNFSEPLNEAKIKLEAQRGEGVEKMTAARVKERNELAGVGPL